MNTIRIISVGALLLATAMSASADLGSRVLEEGVIDLNQVPQAVMAAARDRCAGFIANKARFSWSTDSGMFILDGGCSGEAVRMYIDGNARLDRFVTLEPDE